jgi:hypothetical protein
VACVLHDRCDSGTQEKVVACVLHDGSSSGIVSGIVIVIKTL